MSKMLSTKEVNERIKNIKLLEEYKGAYKKHRFLCFCGKEFISNAHQIIYKHTQSCGCLMYQYKNGNSNYKWKGFGEISGKKWKAIQHNAKIRNIPFEITIEDAWNQFVRQEGKCYYTGEVLVFAKKDKERINTTASLDRVDSNKGYTLDNIVWCHKKVNEIKWDLNIKDLIEWFNKIKNKNEVLSYLFESKRRHYKYKGLEDLSLRFFSRIKKNAKIRNIPFEITIEDAWNQFVRQEGKCYYTGEVLNILSENTDRTASLDRVDSNKGYTLDNIVWCHKIINSSLKKDLSFDDLMFWLEKIARGKDENR